MVGRKVFYWLALFYSILDLQGYSNLTHFDPFVSRTLCFFNSIKQICTRYAQVNEIYWAIHLNKDTEKPHKTYILCYRQLS